MQRRDQPEHEGVGNVAEHSTLPGMKKPAGPRAAAGAISSIIYDRCLPYVLMKVKRNRAPGAAMHVA
jgi:hypothetical protein